MKYLKWLGIEPVVSGNTVNFIDHKNMAVIDASAAYCPPLEFALIGHLI
jgi:hypothetical protein